MENIIEVGKVTYLEASQAVITTLSASSENITIDSDDISELEITTKSLEEKQIAGVPEKVNFVQWGSSNKMPAEVLEKVYKNVGVAKNIEFNAQMIFGDDMVVMKKQRKESDGKIEYIEQMRSEQVEIFDFLELNNFNRIRQELGNDISVFSRAFVEILLNERYEVAAINHLEAAYSRLSVMDEETGKICWHGYSAGWHNGKYEEDLQISPLLDSAAPLRDFLVRTGRLPNDKGVKKAEGFKRYVLDVSLPTPGRFYYMKPYWWSVFESGWYDFACAIPVFKKALMQNSMVIRFHVMINEKFWDKLYSSKGVTDVKDKANVKAEFLTKMNDFLAGSENAGKAFYSGFVYDQVKGAEQSDIVIKPLENGLKGGEYIEDSEEA
ncbi:MAG: hypothetical protein ACRC9X_01025, partial [Bacteroidales bacterium]